MKYLANTVFIYTCPHLQRNLFIMLVQLIWPSLFTILVRNKKCPIPSQIPILSRISYPRATLTITRPKKICIDPPLNPLNPVDFFLVKSHQTPVSSRHAALKGFLWIESLGSRRFSHCYSIWSLFASVRDFISGQESSGARKVSSWKRVWMTSEARNPSWFRNAFPVRAKQWSLTSRSFPSQRRYAGDCKISWTSVLNARSSDTSQGKMVVLFDGTSRGKNWIFRSYHCKIWFLGLWMGL